MVETKFKDDTITTTRATDVRDIYDKLSENFIRTLDECVKTQPQYIQSTSNLLLDYTDTLKKTIQNTILVRKLFVSSWNLPMVSRYTEELTKGSNELTKNIISVIDINNQLIVKALEAARENFKIFNRTIDSVAEFTSNAAKVWNSFLTAQQQQLLKQ